jgi:hypothetical protein
MDFDVIGVISFIFKNATTAGIVLGVIHFRDRMNEQFFDRKSDIIHESRRRSYNYAEEIIEGIITTITSRMRSNIADIKLSCPNGNEFCKYTDDDLSQQFLIYQLVVNNVFNGAIHSKVIEAIRHNGFTDMSKGELSIYKTKKGARLFEIAKDHVSTMAFEHVPALRIHLGSTFSESEAIAYFSEIIDKAIDLKKEAVDDVKKARREYNIFNITKILKGVLNES